MTDISDIKQMMARGCEFLGTEYAILGLLGAWVGGGLAIGGNALLAHFVFEIDPVVPWGGMAIATLSVVAVTLLAGLLSNRGVTDHPPLEILRQET